MGKFPGELLAGETNHVGTWNHGNVREGEDEHMVIGQSIFSHQ